MKVMILTADSNGGYPVPAVKGGAVSTLIEHLVASNNTKRLCDMEIVSLYDEKAEKKAGAMYPNIKFTWVKVSWLLKFLDKCAFRFIRFARKNEKAISFRSPFSLVFYIYKAKNIVNKTDADCIVLENNIPLVRVMKNSKYKGRWYYHFHNIPRLDAGCRDEFKKITKFLCVSKFVANQISKEDSAIGKIDLRKTAVLLNCVDTELFRPINKKDKKLVKLREKYGIREEDFVIVFAGRLSEEKGPDKVLKAMKKLPKNTKCLIVGSLMYGSDTRTAFRDKLYSLASVLENRVIFTGYVPQPELPYIYNLANIAVLPSMWDEPAGLTNLEAMACGIPVISTDVGGIPEYVEKKNLIQRNEKLVFEITKRILYYYNNTNKYLTERKMVEDKFDKKNYLNKFVAQLEMSGDNE